MRRSPSHERRRAAVDAALIFVVVLLMVQMWLLTATLESYPGRASIALRFPACCYREPYLPDPSRIYRFLVRAGSRTCLKISRAVSDPGISARTTAEAPIATYSLRSSTESESTARRIPQRHRLS